MMKYQIIKQRMTNMKHASNNLHGPHPQIDIDIVDNKLQVFSNINLLV